MSSQTNKLGNSDSESSLTLQKFLCERDLAYTCLTQSLCVFVWVFCFFASQMFSYIDRFTYKNLKKTHSRHIKTQQKVVLAIIFVSK